MRLPFLVLPPVCVLLGASTAIWTQGRIDVFEVILVFVGALSAHISVNALNEYFDFRSGLDLRTERTPFSGGSGTLPADPGAATTALGTGLVSLVITALVGLYFVWVQGWGLLPLGLLGLVVIVLYTPWVTRYPFLCLIAPGLGFGLLMVMGTDFSLTGTYTWTAFFASLVPTFLVSNLLLLNQFPDANADRTVGRRHYPITIGRQKSSLIYGLLLLATYLAIVLGVILGYLPPFGLLGLGSLVLAVPTFVGVYRHADAPPALVPLMARNVLLIIITPVLLAVGLLIAA
jgi:1,4-dihydroxy-2-naphthoate octaprenyltransferase